MNKKEFMEQYIQEGSKTWDKLVASGNVDEDGNALLFETGTLETTDDFAKAYVEEVYGPGIDRLCGMLNDAKDGTPKPVAIKDITEEDACPNICNDCGVKFSATSKANGSSGMWRDICSICNNGVTWCNAPRDWNMFSYRREMDDWTDDKLQQHQDWIRSNNKDNTTESGTKSLEEV